MLLLLNNEYAVKQEFEIGLLLFQSLIFKTYRMCITALFTK